MSDIMPERKDGTATPEPLGLKAEAPAGANTRPSLLARVYEPDDDGLWMWALLLGYAEGAERLIVRGFANTQHEALQRVETETANYMEAHNGN